MTDYILGIGFSIMAIMIGYYTFYLPLRKWIREVRADWKKLDDAAK